MTPQQPLTLTAKEKPMNPDPVILAGIALGYIGTFVLVSIVGVRIAFGVRDFWTRNAR